MINNLENSRNIGNERKSPTIVHALINSVNILMYIVIIIH